MLLTHNFLVTSKSIKSCLELLVASGRNKNDSIKTIATTGIINISNSDLDFEDFIFAALNCISQHYPEAFNEIDTIIIVSQSFEKRMPTISTRIQNLLDFNEDCFCQDIIDGCAGLIKAVELVRGLFSVGRKRALVIAGDLNSLLTKESDISTQILFGDGFVFQVYESSQLAKATSRSLIRSNGDENLFLSCDFKNPKLVMNGFEVFRFTRNCVPSLLKKFLDNTGRTLNSYDFVIFHQASLLVVQSLAKICRYKSDFNLFNCSEFGNLGSGSIGAWLATDKSIKLNSHYNFLAIGFGAGLSLGVCDLDCNLKANEHFSI